MNTIAIAKPTPDWPPARERFLLLTLAAIQFTTILDFLIILPLGPKYMEVFHVSPQQFGLIVSSYGISAGVTGLIAGFFLDLFDRKKALLVLYFGFTLGTFFCALAPTYQMLVAARFMAGAFGGVVGAVILAIIGDIIPPERRGRAMGMVMSSFSVASIIGVPLGLYLARFDWHIPFYGLTGISVIILLASWYYTPSIRGHMENLSGQNPMTRTLEVMLHPDHLKAFMFMSLLTCAGFSVFPYISTYMVANVGLTQNQLPWIYLCGGLCTLVTMNFVGRWSDRAGKHRVFAWTSLSAVLPIIAMTNLPRVSVALAITVSTVMMVCMSGRNVPAMAMMTGSVEARYRGGFMSINSAVQQLSMGFAAYITGCIMGQNDRGEITRFPICGILAIVCVLGCIYLARFLKVPQHPAGAVVEPVMVESM